jgi:glycosyltransferase involved in cell wall biosynthesis
MLSIVTINLNNSRGLEKTLQSLSFLKKIYKKEVQLIIVDGLSTDKTYKVIDKYSYYIDNFISEKDSGIYDAMNKGILKAKKENLLFINSGDEIFNNKKLIYIDKILKEKVVYHFFSYIKGYGCTWINNHNVMSHGSLIFPNEKIFFYETQKGFVADGYFIKKNIKYYGVKIVKINLSIFYLGGISNKILIKNLITTNNRLPFFLFIKFIIKMLLVYIIGNKTYWIISYFLKGLKKKK